MLGIDNTYMKIIIILLKPLTSKFISFTRCKYEMSLMSAVLCIGHSLFSVFVVLKLLLLLDANNIAMSQVLEGHVRQAVRHWRLVNNCRICSQYCDSSRRDVHTIVNRRNQFFGLFLSPDGSFYWPIWWC